VLPTDQPPDEAERITAADGGLLEPRRVDFEPPIAEGAKASVTLEADEARVVIGRHHWRIRGASREKGYGSLRVNLSVTDAQTGAFHLDTLDLYGARSRAVFLAAAADELRAQKAELRAELAKVLGVAERAADAAASAPENELAPMTAEERDKAMALLGDPDLTNRIVADVSALGVVREERNALLLYLAAVSRLGAHPLGVLVQSSSAAGKSTLAEAVLSLVPDEAKVSFSAVTGQALYYLGPSDLSHKVLFLSEEEGSARASYALKLLQSEGRLSIASAGKNASSGRLRTRAYEVCGPVALVTTTTAPTVNEELANRLVTLCVSEDIAQTRAIHDAQRQALSVEGLSTRHRRQTIVELHHNAQRLLRAMPVVVPMAEQLTFTEATTRSRRDHAKYLGIICASALLHQYQRNQSEVIVDGVPVSYIEADGSDVALADTLAADLLARSGAELPPASAKLLSSLAEWSGEKPFTRRQAREALGVGDTQLKVHLARLVELEYVMMQRSNNTVRYQLAWHPPSCPPVTTPHRSGSSPPRSGGGRGSVGPRAGRSRGANKTPSHQVGGEFSGQIMSPNEARGDHAPESDIALEGRLHIDEAVNPPTETWAGATNTGVRR
jgi:hypothetical protein